MRIRDLFKETFSALDANRGRSALTILGIVIGISAVIAMTSLIGGVQQSLLSELGLERARLIYINVWGEENLDFDDLEKLKNSVPGYEFVTGTTYTGSEVTSSTSQASAQVQGVKADYFQALGIKFVQGRPFTDAEETSGAMMVVVDQGSLRTLFGDPDAEAVGQTIKLGNDQYTVVGVVEWDGQNWGDMVRLYAPFTTTVNRLIGFSYIDQCFGLATEDTDVDDLVERTKDYFAAYFRFDEEERENNMYIYSMKSIADQLNATMMSFSLLMSAIAGISLLVGGIGIMNMMLTNVTERIREIGLRKALGARASDITKQFLLESIMLCVAGGVIGIVFGYLAALALSGVASGLMDTSGEIHPVINVQTVLLATGICVAIGVLFGYGPARRAAKLDPVESLHYQ